MSTEELESAERVREVPTPSEGEDDRVRRWSMRMDSVTQQGRRAEAESAQ